MNPSDCVGSSLPVCTFTGPAASESPRERERKSCWLLRMLLAAGEMFCCGCHSADNLSYHNKVGLQSQPKQLAENPLQLAVRIATD